MVANMIKDDTEYLAKFQEYIKLFSALKFAIDYAKKSQRIYNVSELENKLIELEAEIKEYRRNQSS
jgi:hypothetical protein